MGNADHGRDPVTASVLTEFLPRFATTGRTVWAVEGREEVAQDSTSWLALLRRYLPRRHRLPTVTIHEVRRRRLFLIDVARFGSQMTTRRCYELSQELRGYELDLIFVTAFESRREFQLLATDCPWGAAAWFADEPDHMIHFDPRPGVCLRLRS